MTTTERRVKTAVTQAVRQRNYRRVRDRALRRLANLYPDQYRELFEEERAKDEQEGKVWLDISGRTNLSYLPPTADSATDQNAKRLGNQSNEGDLG